MRTTESHLSHTLGVEKDLVVQRLRAPRVDEDFYPLAVAAALGQGHGHAVRIGRVPRDILDQVRLVDVCR